MERLTIDEVIEHCKRNTQRWERAEKDRVRLGGKPRNFETDDMSNNFMKEYWEHRQVAEWLEQLKSYKDAEEQGLFLRLPCKVGDTVYALTPFCEICEEALDNTYACENCSKGNYITETKFDYEMIRMLGKTVFLTKEEAEHTLKRMESE